MTNTINFNRILSKFKIASITLIVIMCSCRNQPRTKTGMEGQPIPSFNILLLDSISKLNTATISTEKPIVLFLFNPNCPFCKSQTKEIISEMKSLNGIQFYFLSAFPFDFIKNYSEQYQLGKFKNIIIGQDIDEYFQNYFNVPGVPYIAIYGQDKKLKEVFVGKVSPSKIKNIALN